MTAMVKFRSTSKAEAAVLAVQNGFGYDTHTRNIKNTVFINGLEPAKVRVIAYLKSLAKPKPA
jgi:hypothetical protein